MLLLFRYNFEHTGIFLYTQLQLFVELFNFSFKYLFKGNFSKKSTLLYIGLLYLNRFQCLLWTAGSTCQWRSSVLPVSAYIPSRMQSTGRPGSHAVLRWTSGKGICQLSQPHVSLYMYKLTSAVACYFFCPWTYCLECSQQIDKSSEAMFSFYRPL